MNDIEKLLGIAKDLLEITVLILTANKLLKDKKKSSKTRKRRK